MKRTLIIFAFLLLSGGMTAIAQDLDLVNYGDTVFVTNLPKYEGLDIPEDAPLLTPEGRALALQSIENKFGKIEKYEECYGACTGLHYLTVTLDSGDEITFENGCLNNFTIVSSRFPVAMDWFKGGLRVGSAPAQPKKESIRVERSENDPNVFHFWDDDMRSDLVTFFEMGPDGLITEIHYFFNAC